MTKPIPYPLRGAWLITDEGADLVRTVWETAHATGKAERIALALEARGGQSFKNERNCVVNDGVAVMDIDGPLMRKAELFSDISGATSYQWIGATADALRADPSVKKVIIRANSPGGEAAGAGECAEKIAKLAAEKHVEGYVETQAASAMYWLLAQCSHITAHPTAQVGWIGAIRNIVDDSARDEKNGVQRIQVVSKGAEQKRQWPISDAVVARVKREVDEFGRLFTAAVASGRGVSPETVLDDFGRGDGMFAEQALTAGLIDAVGDFESTLARVSVPTTAGATYASRPNKGAAKMATKPNDGVRAADSDNEWKCTGCKEMMGPSATKYCAKCSEGEGDEDKDEDEDEAKALGLDPKASLGARRARAMALVGFEKKVLAATGIDPLAKDAHDKAIAIFSEGAAARSEIAKVRADGQKAQLRSVLERGLAGAPGEQPRLSLGLIQKTLPTTLRGDAKKAWAGAMEKLAKDADDAKASVTAAMVLDAACSVSLSAEDIEAISDFVKEAPPLAAANHVEPLRDTDKEAADLDAASAQVKQAADKARAALDRNKPAAK